MPALNPDHLTIDELQHYGELGFVVGIDPNVAGDLERIAEVRAEDRMEDCADCQAKDDELEAMNLEIGDRETEVAELKTRLIETMEHLGQMFKYEPAQGWFPETYKRYRQLMKEEQERVEAAKCGSD